eukprot:gene3111-3579_t
MAGIVEPELPEYIFNDLFPMDSEINNWVNHDSWYTTQCIDHYDTDRFTEMDLTLAIDNPSNDPQLDQQSGSSPLSTFSSASISSNPNSALKALLVSDGHNLSHNPHLSVDTDDSQMPSIYVMGEGAVFSESGCSSPTRSVCRTPNSDADTISLREDRMSDFLQSQKGIETFAKAHNVLSEDLLHFLESKKHDEIIEDEPKFQPEFEKKHEARHRRRRHRGSYSKDTCLQVIEFVKKGYSARATAKKFGIPKSTVHNWLHEDVTTRPERGHRKKDLYNDKHCDVEHEYLKNVSELGNSLAHTSLHDELVSRRDHHACNNVSSVKVIKAEQPLLGSRPDAKQDLCPMTSQTMNRESQLVRLLTSNTNGQQVVSKIKAEPIADDMETGDGGNGHHLSIDYDFDELLHPEDWIEHEQWYKQQYLHHYDHYYNDSLNGKNRKCYGSYSNNDRIKATEFVRSGNSLSAASKEFHIPKSTIHTWLNEGNTPCELPAEVESAVVDEIEQVKDGEISPNLIVIKKKAEEVAAPRVEKFRASFAWCRDFMKRHYMDKNDDVDSSKRICRSDDHKPSINNFVSVLGLAPSNSEPVTEVAGNLMS